MISEQLQTKIVNGELVDIKTMTNLSGQLRRILLALRQRNDQRGPAPPSIHEHLAAYGTRLGDDSDDGDEEDEP